MEFEILKNTIFEIRGNRVMLDFHLAELYEVEVKRLNEQVKRNIERFPKDFMFQLNENEVLNLRPQILICVDRFLMPLQNKALQCFLVF
jgi:hypothetical protein